MRAWIGRSIVGIGVIHTVFGLVFMRSTLLILWNERLLNTVNGQPPREATFWFLYAGLLMILLGSLINRLERNGLAIPPLFVWSLFALTVIGVVVMPISGLWLLGAPSVGLVVRMVSRKDA